MTDFVYDVTGLPDGKTEAASPATAGPSNIVTSAEHNTAMQAIKDLREAVRRGQFLGLEDRGPGEPALPVLGARIRHNAGRLQVTNASLGLGVNAWRGIDPLEIRPEDFGAVGNGSDNDSVPLQAAIDAAIAEGRTLRLQAKVYATASELVVSGSLSMTADSAAASSSSVVPTIKAIGAAWTPSGGGMRSVIKIAADGCRFDGVKCDANNTAKYAWFLSRSSFGVWHQCSASNGLIDGFHSSRYLDEVSTFSLNDSNHFEDCWAVSNGRQWSSVATGSEGIKNTVTGGTVSTVDGSNVITFSNDFDFATLAGWLRYGDFIAVSTPGGSYPAAGAMYLRVGDVAIDVGARQITVGERSIPNQTLSGRQFVIGQGAGYWAVHFGDNNLNQISRGLWRLSGGCGIAAHGLVGMNLENPQLDFNAFYGIVVGPGDTSQTYATAITHPYMESNQVAHMLFSGAYGVNVHTPEWGAGAVLNYIVKGGNGVILPGATENMAPIGLTRSDVPSTAGFNFRNIGKFSVGSYYASTSASSISIDGTGGTFAFVAPSDGVDCTLSASPVISGGTDGQVLIVYNQSVFNITLESVAARNGSRLFLKSYKLVLPPQKTVTLIYNDNISGWAEIANTGNPESADSTASPGAATQHTQSGRVAIAAAASSVVVTNTLVTATSRIFAVLQTSDATLTQILRVVPAAGSFTIVGNVAATAAVNVAWKLET